MGDKKLGIEQHFLYILLMLDKEYLMDIIITITISILKNIVIEVNSRVTLTASFYRHHL